MRVSHAGTPGVSIYTFVFALVLHHGLFIYRPPNTSNDRLAEMGCFVLTVLLSLFPFS